MSHQQKLYQQALVEHHKDPVGFELPIKANFSASGSNHTCGDEITLSAKIESGIFSELSFNDESCAICRASASLLCQYIKTKSIEQAQKNIKNISKSILQQQVFDEEYMPLSSVAQYPVRQQCALLPWQSLTKIISQYYVEQALNTTGKGGL